MELEWTYVSVFDNGEGSFTCEHCPKTGIRYEHTIRNKSTKELMTVGCVCAEKLTGDSVSPREQEKRAKARARLLKVFVERPWRVSAAGNQTRTWIDGLSKWIIVLRQTPKGWTASWKLDGEEGWRALGSYHPSPEEARKTVFERLFPEQFTRRDKQTMSQAMSIPNVHS